MNRKVVSVFLCMLLMVSGLVPLTGLIGAAGNGQTQQDSPQGWIPLPPPLPVGMVLEQSVSRRMSYRAYTAAPVTDEELSTVLWAAYGRTANGGRTVYSPNGTYSTTLYVIRNDATYIYVAANHSLLLFKTGNYLYIGQYDSAQVKFGLVWNTSIAPDLKGGLAQIGMIGQNIYFEANTLDLGVVTTGYGVDELNDLGLPPNEEPEIIMPMGHPSPPYSFTYNPLPPANLPGIVNNTLTLFDAVSNRSITHEWSTVPLTLLEESQLLWCSYGYSYYFDNVNNDRHRTLPSAVDIYPFKIFAANETGVYQYAPQTHSVSLVVSGDRREAIQSALAPVNISIASAPFMVLAFWDQTLGSQWPTEWWYYESGAITHNVLLEGTALNLTGNVVTVFADQNGLRTALGISAYPNYLGMAIIPVGHLNTSHPNTPPGAPTLAGPAEGKIGIRYNYTVQAVDVDGDAVSYFIDWGDGTNSSWVGPVASNTSVLVNHTWAKKGTYTVKAKAKDTRGLEGAWMTLQVTMPTSLFCSPLWKMIERFLSLLSVLRGVMIQR
jgi:nitroreductase